MKDLWSKKVTETAGKIGADVPAHGTVMYRISRPSGGWDAYPPATSVSANTQPAYPGGPAVVASGQPNSVTTTFTNSGRMPATDVNVSLDAPAGWAVQPTTSTFDNEVGTDGSFDTTWTVTPPAGTEPGTYTLNTTAAYTWDDGTKSDNVAGSTQVLVPNAPPSGDAYVSDVPWTSATNGWGPPERDRSNGETGAHDGHTITINGQTYAKGVGAHAPSEIDIYVGKQCSTFTSDVGVDDEKTAYGSVVFQVSGGQHQGRRQRPADGR